jgi:hypothetical protein
MTILLLLLYAGGGLAPFCLCDKDLLDYTVNNIRKFSPCLLFLSSCFLPCVMRMLFNLAEWKGNTTLYAAADIKMQKPFDLSLK